MTLYKILTNEGLRFTQAEDEAEMHLAMLQYARKKLTSGMALKDVRFVYSVAKLSTLDQLIQED